MPPKSSLPTDTAPTVDVPSTPAAAASAAPVTTTPAAPVVDTAAKLKAIAAENAAAKTEIETYFGPERWTALMKQAAQRNLTPANVETLCGNLRRTRRQWVMVEGNDRAALILAANHLILELGRRPTQEDEAALENALKASPTPAP